jgi:hypothetical protein
MDAVTASQSRIACGDPAAMVRREERVWAAGGRPEKSRATAAVTQTSVVAFRDDVMASCCTIS